MTAATPLFLRFVRFLGKVQFTIVLLLGGVVIMTVGTIVESRASREVAWSQVYGTLWFDLFLLLIGVNLVVAVINRIPIRRHQWPFVLTHFAIAMLLAGGWISRTFGYEGRLVIFEGREQSRLLLDASEIRARWHEDTAGSVESVFSLPDGRRLEGRVLQEEGRGRPGIRIADVVGDGVVSIGLADAGPAGAPGVEFLLTDGRQQVRQWLIAGDPAHGRKDLGSVEVELRLAGPEAGAPARAAAPAKPRIAILLGPDGQLHLQLSSAAGRRQTVPIAVGRTVALGPLGLDFQLERLLASARPEIGVRPAPEEGEGGGTYVRLEIDRRGESRSLWLARGGSSSAVELDGAELELSFGPQTRPLPFAIVLEDFELIRHPGSSRPSEYRSRIRVKPTGGEAPPRDAVISMNRPLDVSGFRLFQSSYQLGRGGGPDATVLSVSYDPGVPVVYVSFVLIILGIAWGLRGVERGSERAGAARRSGAKAPAAGPPPAKREACAREARRAGVALGLLLAAVVGLSSGVASRAQASEPGIPVEETRSWAILADGRVKPLVTFANQTALAITGRKRFDGLSGLEILWGYVLASRDFADRPYLRIDSHELKAAVGLAAGEKRFSFEALLRNPAYRSLVEKALERRREEQDLSRVERDALDAYEKLDRIAGLTSGEALAIVPLLDEGGAWRSPQQLREADAAVHEAVYGGFARLGAAYAGGDAEAFRREARSLAVALRNVNPAVYPSESRIARELFYEDFNAFGKAWKLYLVGFLVVLLLGFSERPWGYAAGVSLIGAGFVCHSIGIATRWAIAGRAPVSDMYESLVFMGWGAIAFGLVPEALYRKRFLAIAAGLTGFLCLAFAENLPIDSAINPLVPVLAHTAWLSIHVMTVMLAYSALALATVLGHVMLFIGVFQPEKTVLLSSVSKLLYKTLQVGLLFLAAGIIFGAIWANESWGRYWGWDPKETWSLITFFVYLAIIHARFAGWLRHFGLAASSILGFLAVVMTYYGVNFILAAGLHSYGFSEGGQRYAVFYAALEIAIVVGAYLQYGSGRGPVRRPSVQAGSSS